MIKIVFEIFYFLKYFLNYFVSVELSRMYECKHEINSDCIVSGLFFYQWRRALC